jgi:hypothetical protein
MPTIQLTVADDKEFSPFTGFTRQHWIEITGKIIAGFMQYADPATGVLKLIGNPEETAHHHQLKNPGGLLESFERTHMVTAAYIAATGKTTVPGFSGDVAELFRCGVDELTRPDSTLRARAVQSYPFGLGTMIAMAWAPAQLLDPLEARVKENMAKLLAAIIERQQHHHTNTLLFSMMPAIIMEKLGAPYNRGLLDDHFENILGMYNGDGWFIDGWNRGIDHYNYWGFILYLNALVHYDQRWRARYAERVREITRAHEETLPYFFSRNGGPIPKGRSLCYRFAALSGIGFAQLSGLSQLDPGLARRMSSGCLKYFWEHGCLSERGLLEVGYRASNSAVGEDYNDYGGPYWAGTGLAALVLPAGHPFWTAEEKPLAADLPGIKRKLVRGACAVLKADGRTGETRWHNAGEMFLHRRVWQAGSKYFQHTYSSTIGYALAGDQGPELLAGRTGISPDGKIWSYRTWPRVLALDEKHAVSAWDAWPGQEGLTGVVFTETQFLDDGELHVFWHQSDGPRFLALGGYAVQVPHGEQPKIETRKDQITISSTLMKSVLKVTKAVPGKIESEEVRPRPGFKHAHIFEGWAVFTKWTSNGPVKPGEKIELGVDAGVVNSGK